LSKSIYNKALKITVVPVIFVCKTGSFTPSVERRLKVSENRVQRRMFGPKREEVTG
jgi:hypothetical protein